MSTSDYVPLLHRTGYPVSAGIYVSKLISNFFFNYCVFSSLFYILYKIIMVEKLFVDNSFIPKILFV